MADHRKTDAAAAKGFPAQILPESAIELHMLLENIPGGVCLLEIGPQIRIIYASSGFFRMIGSAENEFVLPCALEALRIHPDYLAEYENALRQGAQDGEMPAQAHRLQSAAGGWIWRRAQAVRTDCACSPYPVMLELSSDISETVALEESLAESQAHLLAVLDQNPHPLWQVDIAKRSVRIYNAVSQSAIPEREFKNFPETLISRGIVHSDSAENFRKFAADLLAGKKEDSASFSAFTFVLPAAFEDNAASRRNFLWKFFDFIEHIVSIFPDSGFMPFNIFMSEDFRDKSRVSPLPAIIEADISAESIDKFHCMSSVDFSPWTVLALAGGGVPEDSDWGVALSEAYFFSAVLSAWFLGILTTRLATFIEDMSMFLESS